MNSVVDARLSSEAFAQFAEVDAPLVESEPIETKLCECISFRLERLAGFAP